MSAFLKLVLVIAIASGGYIAWKKIDADRRLAEAAAPVEKHEAVSAKPMAPEKLPDLAVPNPEIVDNGPKIPEGGVPDPAPAKTGGQDGPLVDLVDEGDRAPTASERDSNEPAPFGDSAGAKGVLDALKASKYRFTSQVKSVYLAYLQGRTKDVLAEIKKPLPDEFLAWVKSDPVVAVTVYGARAQPEKVALMLYSLEQDLGRDAVRGKYKQLALATAVVAASDGWTADITPRKPLKLAIPGDPRKPVDTHDKTRKLDTDDHIVNYFKDHAPIKGIVVGGMKEGLAELEYDKKGVAKFNGNKGAPVMVKREIIPADVFADVALQKEFNEYMKAQGETFAIHCGNHVIYPDLHEMIKGPESAAIKEAYVRIRDAFIKKGLLAERDAPATPAERCAYVIRNDLKLRSEISKTKKRPFPLDAPWPVMTLLAANDQPLREREDLYNRFMKNGELHTYGEYIGPIAQQYDFQSARRLAPYSFGYGSVQMMLKDGGVCGTMATIATRSYNMLGIPSITAGQPGHCALIVYHLDGKTRNYVCSGEQYVTGGDDETHPHGPWPFGDVNTPRPMVYHQSVAWGVNADLESYLDAMLAYNLFRSLSEETRREHGPALLAGVITTNPFYFPAVDAAQSVAGTPKEQLALVKLVEDAVKTKQARAGFPCDLFLTEVRSAALKAITAGTPDSALAGDIAALRKKIPPPKEKKA